MGDRIPESLSRLSPLGCAGPARCGVSCCQPCVTLMLAPAARGRRPDHAAVAGAPRACDCVGPVGDPGHGDLAVRRGDDRRGRQARPGLAGRGCWCGSRGRRWTPPASAAGFSGSPDHVPGRRRGAARTSAAISESVGEYGNHVVLVTPDRGDAARRSRHTAGHRAPGAGGLLRSARPLAGALTVSGLSRAHARPADRRARQRRRERPCWPRPPGRSAASPRQALVPGASVAAMLSTGDVGAGRGGHGHLPRRRPHLGLRPPVGRPRAALPVRGGRLRVRRDLEPARHPRPRGRQLQAHLRRAATSRAPSAPTRSASISGTSARPPAASRSGRGARARRRRPLSRSTRSLADERRLGYGASLSLAAPLGASQGLEQRAPQLRAGHDLDVLPGEARGRARADRLLQPLLRRLLPARRHHDGGVAGGRLRPAASRHRQRAA